MLAVRHAKLPLNPDAVKAADEALYKNHPELDGRKLTMGPEDGALRKEWMDSYLAAGGAVDSPKPPSPPPGPTTPCPPSTYDKQLKEAMKQAWKDSFKPDGTVTEQGGSIIRTKDGKVEIRRASPGASGSIPLSNYPKLGDGEQLIGTFHTHPYSKDEGGYTGVSFSGGDIRNFLKEEQGDAKYVMAGDKVFVLTKDDPARAAKADPQAALDTWNDTYSKSSGSLPDRADAATKAAVKDTGLGYKTIDP